LGGLAASSVLTVLNRRPRFVELLELEHSRF
jgi:hypothetical protein